MREEQNRQKLFTRRTLILAGGQLGLLSLLGVRLYYLQVLQAERYKTLAEDNRINLRLLAPPRGQIFDRYGRLLATNRENYRLIVVPEQTGDLRATLHSVSQLINLSPEVRDRVLEEAARKRSFMPVLVRDNLSWEEVSRIEVNSPDLPGTMIDVGLARQYPYGPALAHVVGYVGAPSERDLTGDPLLELPDFRIGKSGVERALDDALRGSAGTQKVEVNAFGRVIREVERDEGQARRRCAIDHRCRVAALHHRTAGRRKRRGRGDGYLHRRDPRPGLGSRVRPQHVHQRAVGGTVERADQQSACAADQQDGLRAVSAWLHLQDGGGAGGSGKRRD